MENLTCSGCGAPVRKLNQDCQYCGREEGDPGRTLFVLDWAYLTTIRNRTPDLPPWVDLDDIVM